MLTGSTRPFPAFQFDHVLLAPESLRYSPTGEWIFPGLFRAGRHLAEPLAEWYMYYSPHNSPGGICLATADNLEGPWSEYPHNPLIGKIWDPHYSVSHVASPHPLWIEAEKRLFLYFHGENTTTRLATSADGLSFQYEGVAADVTGFDDISECSYARVFAHPLPDRGAQYVLIMMGNNRGTRRLYLAWSPDGRTWETQRAPMVSPPAGLDDGQTSAPWLERGDDGNLYILHHCDNAVNGTADFYITACSDDLTEFGTPELFHKATTGPPDDGRVCDIVLQRDDSGQWLLFYAAGRRLAGIIALAKPI